MECNVEPAKCHENNGNIVDGNNVLKESSLKILYPTKHFRNVLNALNVLRNQTVSLQPCLILVLIRKMCYWKRRANGGLGATTDNGDDDKDTGNTDADSAEVNTDF